MRWGYAWHPVESDVGVRPRPVCAAQVPPGWQFRVRTLGEDLVIAATYDDDPPNTIVLDEFENNYQRVPTA